MKLFWRDANSTFLSSTPEEQKKKLDEFTNSIFDAEMTVLNVSNSD